MHADDIAPLARDASLQSAGPGSSGAEALARRHRNEEDSSRANAPGAVRLHEQAELHGSLELRSLESRRMVFDCMRRLDAALTLQCRLGHLEARVVAVEGADLVLCLDEPFAGGDCTGVIELYDVSFVLAGRAVRLERGGLARHRVLWASPRLHLRNRRRSTRIALSRGEANLRWAYVADGAPRVVNSPILDLMPTGVRVALTGPDVMPRRSAFVAELQLGTTLVPLMANPLPRGAGLDARDCARLQLTTGSRHVELVRAYLERRFPRLVARHRVGRAQLAGLLEASGYLKLRPGEGVSPAWAAFAGDYSLDVVYESAEGQLLGHISATRAYSTTYVFHQLATLGGHRESGICRKMLYELVSSVPHAFDGASAFGLAYFDLERRWHQLLFTQYIDWLGDPSLGTLFAWDRFERDADAPQAPGVKPSIDHVIGALGQDDLVPAVALIRSQLPPLLADALDIFPQHLTSDALNGAPARTRTAFGLRVADKLVGVALCETGPAEASLFNLFNLAQFYFCTERASPDVSLQLALLAEVRRFYARRGVHNPLVVAPASTFAAEAEPGTRLAERMGSVAFAGEGVRHWEGYCSFTMGHLYTRKRAAKSKEMSDA